MTYGAFTLYSAAKQTVNYNTQQQHEPSQTALLLASASHGRKALLQRLGLPFDVCPADIDETALPGETPAQLVERLSRAKAQAVRSRFPGHVVIGSDQVAVFEGVATSKPGTRERAHADLSRFAGGAVEFHTGLCLAGPGDGPGDYVCDRTTVWFRDLTDAEINRYLDRDQPFDCAGAFRLEALGSSLFDRVISEDPTALLGLPLIALCGLLRKAGFQLP